MKGVNQCYFIGNLGRDPEMKYLQDGTPLAKLSIAVNETWNDKQGNRQERTEWIRGTAWGKLAEIANEYLKKGSGVFIQGRLQTSSWEDKNGEKRYSTEVNIATLVMLGGGGGDGTRESAAPEEPEEVVSDQDVPF